MSWEAIQGALTSIGFKTELIFPLAIFILLGYLCFWRKIDKALEPIKFAIIEIQRLFKTGGVELDHKLTETRSSPLKPTNFGLKLLKESGLDKLISDKKDQYLKELKTKLGKTYSAYDVQEEAIKLIKEKEDNKSIIPIKDYAFKNGFNVEIILRLGGLILRDEYLKKYHPDWIQS